jgi:hypothetical protein
MLKLRRPAMIGCGLLWIAFLWPALTACTAMKSLMLQAAPKSETIPAEFNRLTGKKVLIFVWAPPEILWDYPKVRLDLSSYVGAYLGKNVEKITLIEPLRVEEYLEKGNSFETDPVELGKHFRADMVVHLSVYQFSMRDPGMAHYYRGRINSSVVVHDLTREGEPAERIPLKDVMVAVPDKAMGYPNIRADQIRQATYDAFAVEVGKKFHEFERPIG